MILAETDCISYSTNTLEKGMNPIILPAPRQTKFFSLGVATSHTKWQLVTPVATKKNSEFKPVKLRLKIDLVSYPA